MYLLYHFPLSPSARRVVALLEEAALPYELRHVALDQGEHLSPEYLAVNPNHQVPTLVDGDLVIHESNAILRYLCHKHRLEAWYPADPAARARTEQWLDWSQCRLFPAMADIVVNKLFLGPKGDPAAIARGEARVAELAPILEAALADRPFLVGATPTIADLSVDSCITQLGMAGSAPSLPRIEAWSARLGAIPGVQRSRRALATPEPA
jgi:glutathione S-transferase